LRFRAPIYFHHVTRNARFAVSFAGLAALTFILSSCDVGGIRPIFPDPVSPNGQAIFDTYLYISIPAIIVFIGVEAALLWVAIRYRRARQPLGYVPPQVHGNTGLEIVWTVVPLILVLGIAAYSFVELQQNFQPISNQQMTVIITGHQFGWNYDYGNGVVVHQEGSLTSEVPAFVVPTNTLVKLQFRATDVIHSWWVPAISGKTDAVPGYDNFSWLKISKPGKWVGECAELCGVGHASMQIIVQAMDKSDYDAWVAKQKSSASPAASPSPSQ
jgi:cytochrome c oxidase subunit II